MLKVLIVDDEFMIIEGCKRMVPWEKNGYRVVGEASNGLRALNMIRSLHPDIVLTDIRMPGMSGMEMIREAIRRKYPCKFIIISGYEDFNCCQEALRLGVSDYLLKPIDFSTVISKFNNVAEKIRQENLLSGYRVSSYFNRVLNGISSEMDNCELDLFPQKYHYCVVAARPADGSAADLAQLPAGEQTLLYRGAVGGTAFFVIAVPDALCMPGWRADCERKVAGLFRGVRASEVYTGAGTLCAANDIRVSFRQAVELVENRVFYGRADCSPVTRHPYSCEEEFEMETLTGQIVDAVRSANELEAIQRLKALFDRFSTALMSKSDVMRVVAPLFRESADEISEKFEIVEQDSTAKDREFGSFPAVTLTELRNAAILRVHTLVQNAADSAGAVSIEQVKKYVRQHYMQNITLKSAAKAFFLNPSYLSRLFSQKENVTFIDYLNQQRMKAAMQLLRTTELSVEQIAERVGFADYRYFEKVFKKYNAISPQKYRKKRYERLPECGAL